MMPGQSAPSSFFAEIQTIRILLVEDDEEDKELLARNLREIRNPAYEIEWVPRLDQALDILGRQAFDVILLDLSLPDSYGEETFNRVHEKAAHLPIIILTGLSEEKFSLELMRRGAQDFLNKEHMSAKLLSRLIRYAIERKKSLSEIFLTQEKYRTIFENSAIAITVTDRNERIVSWNRFAEGLLGMTHEDLYGKPVSSLYSEEEWRRIRSYRIREKGSQPILEAQVIRKDGTVLDVDISITVLKDEAGNITGSIGIMKDISERKRAAREIKRAEEQYRAIFENSAVAITMTDADEKIISWNKFAEQFLGMTYEDLYLRSVSSLYPEDEWKKIRGYNIRTKGMQHVLETKIFRKDGTLVDVDISISVLKDANGKITGSIGVIKDISERKRLQLMKDEFVSTVSHELRTPIGIVRESMAQFQEGMLGDTTDLQRHVLSVSVNALDRLSRIIDDLLDVSKIEAGKMDLRRESVDLVQLIKEVAESFNTKMNDRKLQLQSEFAAEKMTAEVDPDRVIQVFTNLLSNSIKFTESGTIGVAARYIGDNFVECEVSDTGRGISEEDRLKVFSKFEQFGRKLPEAEKGTGLGLSICKGIVELHGGQIQVLPHEPNGTRFVFTFPMKAPAA